MKRDYYVPIGCWKCPYFDDFDELCTESGEYYKPSDVDLEYPEWCPLGTDEFGNRTDIVS